MASVQDRRADALGVLNGIVDPCSAANGSPIGLADMGIIEELEVSGGHVRVRLLPTFPGCLFVGIFHEEATGRLRELDWCESVEVELASAEDGVWTEARMAPAARDQLDRRRADLQARLRVHRSTSRGDAT